MMRWRVVRKGYNYFDIYITSLLTEDKRKRSYIS